MMELLGFFAPKPGGVQDIRHCRRPCRAKRRNTTVALRADPVAIRDLAGAAPFKRCGRRVAGLGMARNPLGWQEDLDYRGL